MCTPEHISAASFAPGAVDPNGRPQVINGVTGDVRSGDKGHNGVPGSYNRLESGYRSVYGIANWNFRRPLRSHADRDGHAVHL